MSDGPASALLALITSCEQDARRGTVFSLLERVARAGLLTTPEWDSLCGHVRELRARAAQWEAEHAAWLEQRRSGASTLFSDEEQLRNHEEEVVEQAMPEIVRQTRARADAWERLLLLHSAATAPRDS